MACNGCSDGCFDGSVQLQQGPQGADGTNGSFGGWCLEWDFDSSTANTTGSGELRFNNATLSSVTNIFINDTNSNSVDVSNFLASVGSSPYGRIKVSKESDSSVFWLGEVTAADNTSVAAEYDLTVTHIVSNGTFTDGDDLVVCLMPENAGANGSNGADGVAVVQVNMTPTSTTSNAYGTNEQSDTFNGTTENFGDVDDILRMRFVIAGDKGSVVSPIYYDFKILYGSDTIFDTTTASIFRLQKNNSVNESGCSVEIDLIVTATDTITPILKYTKSEGSRTSKYRIASDTAPPTLNVDFVLPSVSISNPISGNNDIKLQIKNTDNSSTVDIVYYELIKLLA